jgi:hypothetical protein
LGTLHKDSSSFQATVPMRSFYLALLISGLATCAAQSQDLGWRRYSLPQTTTSVDVPAALFPVDAGPPEKGPGRMFRTADGSADLSVYALRNEGQPPAEFLRTHFPLPRQAIVYRRVTGDMVTVSGFRRNKIWYARSILPRPNFAVWRSIIQRATRSAGTRSSQE